MATMVLSHSSGAWLRFLKPENTFGVSAGMFWAGKVVCILLMPFILTLHIAFFSAAAADNLTHAHAIYVFKYRAASRAK
jgi:hypothetical protein